MHRIPHVLLFHAGNNSHWGSFLQEKAVRWPVHIASWIINGRNNPFHVVHYEDLKMNATREIIKLLEFLGVPQSDQEVNERLKFGFSDFYRITMMSSDISLQNRSVSLQVR